MEFPNPDFTVQDKIECLERWIIVNSCIYYELDENVVPDYRYDTNASQLAQFVVDYPEDFRRSRYHQYFYDFRPGSISGFDLIGRIEKSDPELLKTIRYEAKMVVDLKNNDWNDAKKEGPKPKKEEPFLAEHQLAALDNIRNGCILNGGVGSGKTRTGLYYYFKEQGGSIGEHEYVPMKEPKDLYIITTAAVRDKLEFEKELANFLISKDPEKNKLYSNKIVIDSWNNIKKYKDVYGAFFIFDEDRVTGNGVWVKSFLNIARKNDWIILSATPGDTWEQYIPVFIANGFYKNKTEFAREHIRYSQYTKYPKIEGYYNTGRLIKYRNQILVDMDFTRHTIPHHEDVFCTYDIQKYKEATKTRWDPFKDEPIQQASVLCYILRRIVNGDDDRQTKLLEIYEKHPRMIVFYNFDYELEILKGLYYGERVEIAEWNGHAHNPVPTSESWVYLVQYTAGCEGWNCIKTDTIVFYSQNYSYKVMAQASGRIDRLNTPFKDLYYYHFRSRSGIDVAIAKALREKRDFNERRFVNW